MRQTRNTTITCISITGISHELSLTNMRQTRNTTITCISITGISHELSLTNMRQTTIARITCISVSLVSLMTQKSKRHQWDRDTSETYHWYLFIFHELRQTSNISFASISVSLVSLMIETRIICTGLFSKREFYRALLQKRSIILRSLLIVATPYQQVPVVTLWYQYPVRDRRGGPSCTSDIEKGWQHTHATRWYWYGVATISSLLRIASLFRRI